MGQYLQTNIRLTDSRKHLECGEALSCDGVGVGGQLEWRTERECTAKQYLLRFNWKGFGIFPKTKQQANGKCNYTHGEMCQTGCELPRHAVSLLCNEQLP